MLPLRFVSSTSQPAVSQEKTEGIQMHCAVLSTMMPNYR